MTIPWWWNAILIITTTIVVDAWMMPNPTKRYSSRLHDSIQPTCFSFGGTYLVPVTSIQDEDNDFISNVIQVPTYAAVGNNNDVDDTDTTGVHDNSRNHYEQQGGMERLGLEGVLSNHHHHYNDDKDEEWLSFPQACVLQECEEILSSARHLIKPFNVGLNHHGAMQVVVSPKASQRLAAKLAPFIDIPRTSSTNAAPPRISYAGINARWRIYEYNPNSIESFQPHVDVGFPPSGINTNTSSLVWDTSNGTIQSRLTLLLYLNDDFEGGHTRFYAPSSGKDENDLDLLCSIQPKQGSVLLFPQAVGQEQAAYAKQHWPLHEGSPVRSGRRAKYVIRSDVMFCVDYEIDNDNDDNDNVLFRHDKVVRDAFLPRDHNNVQRATNHLYQPHMGVEHVGAFLYSFVRFTKAQYVVEIGSGYTTAWILQALHDNKQELHRMLQLGDERCRLMDWPWTNRKVVLEKTTNDGNSKNGQCGPRLLCIDNCLHQKETATGATLVAETLGLKEYLTFMEGVDAFDVVDIEEESVDVLWCDFGVGDRMIEFLRLYWPSVRPGGFLVCHSTLTNQQTREWVEAVRRRGREDETGLPEGTYTEMSLLEPHKHYQNSLTLLQKRVGKSGRPYEEPIYSQFA
eukprot:CAMPEP_0118722170 /NCGR_PEP_ID=MMETSP0800-20121206/31195_1 /TAXON_ID=210618 ORGANISM="Striatella unipunctata, Strain CCMP2910" /NCGR_SAMPLE_ID=MMETSP0800 /ASSEMBLY_ACC=CAM_ASM_000638 /LENGTH=626 /DNA_ID=CAMNT_0006630247 /DNA_START=60 /DNA_END=1941 /DNA_ORIENTATION=+